MALAEQAIANADYGDALSYAVRAKTLAALRPKLAKGGIAGVAVEYTPEMINSVIADIRALRAEANTASYGSGKMVKIRPKAVGE